MKNKHRRMKRYEYLSRKFTQWTGSVWAFFVAFGFIGIWLIFGLFAHFSKEWNYALNTVTTLLTFLMIFLIQHSVNKDYRAIHAKLNEIIATLEGADSKLINIEDASEEELQKASEKTKRSFKESGEQGQWEEQQRNTKRAKK